MIIVMIADGFVEFVFTITQIGMLVRPIYKNTEML